MHATCWLRTLLLAATLLAIACAAPSAPAPGSGPAPSSSAAPRTEKRIVYSSNVQLDVRPSATIGSRQAILPLIGAGLTTTDGQGNRLPLLAQQLLSIDNGSWQVNPDGTMVTTFTLRSGAQWHDGTPITADDFLFSLDVGRDRAVPGFGIPAYALIASSTAPDPMTLVVNWTEPYIDADSLFSWDQAYGAPLPRHVLEDAFTNNKDGFLDLSYWTQDYIGSGPFKVVSWDPDVSMQLVAHDGFALGRPKLDRIDVQLISDESTLMANLLAGTVDATRNVGSIDGAKQLMGQWQNGSVVVDLGGGNWVELVPQLLDPTPAAITDLRFRTALALSIDRQAITDELAGGFSPVPLSFLSPNQPAYAALDATLPRYPYDPGRAGQMLADLGYTKGSDGTLRDATGQPLSVEVRTQAGGEYVKAGTAIADDWHQLGVAANPAPITPQLANNREYTATFPGFWVKPGLTDAPAVRGLSSAAAPLASNDYVAPAPRNDSRYMNPELDDLVTTYYRTIPQNDRINVMGQIVHITTDQLVFLGLYYLAQPGAHNNRLTGVGPQWPTQSFPWNAYSWDVTS